MNTTGFLTPYGRARFFVHPDDGLAPDVVHTEHAWWFPERKGPDHGWKESCVNLLFGHDHFDRDLGAEALKWSLCRLERESGGSRGENDYALR